MHWGNQETVPPTIQDLGANTTGVKPPDHIQRHQCATNIPAIPLCSAKQCPACGHYMIPEYVLYYTCY